MLAYAKITLTSNPATDHHFWIASVMLGNERVVFKRGVYNDIKLGFVTYADNKDIEQMNVNNTDTYNASGYEPMHSKLRSGFV